MNLNSELYEHLTEGMFFSSTRHITKSTLQDVVNRAKFSNRDREILHKTSVIAPKEGELYTVLPELNGPVCFFPPTIENLDRENIEYTIVSGLASAVSMGKNVGKNPTESEIHRTVADWGWTAGQRTSEAVGA